MYHGTLHQSELAILQLATNILTHKHAAINSNSIVTSLTSESVN
jgi:hypothetical protein